MVVLEWYYASVGGKWVVLVDVILYGSPHIQVEENTQIFLAVQDFIINTTRF